MKARGDQVGGGGTVIPEGSVVSVEKADTTGKADVLELLSFMSADRDDVRLKCIEALLQVAQRWTEEPLLQDIIKKCLSMAVEEGGELGRSEGQIGIRVMLKCRCLQLLLLLSTDSQSRQDYLIFDLNAFSVLMQTLQTAMASLPAVASTSSPSTSRPSAVLCRLYVQHVQLLSSLLYSLISSSPSTFLSSPHASLWSAHLIDYFISKVFEETADNADVSLFAGRILVVIATELEGRKLLQEMGGWPMIQKLMYATRTCRLRIFNHVYVRTCTQTYVCIH
eukprot:GHVS01039720.1.p1 GENE.GHVS01039720.1~~GHVS01039720.1.p1  ORF type:complete len:280 (-),score=55.96 GHVS01039720.1:180-1019(-)